MRIVRIAAAALLLAAIAATGSVTAVGASRQHTFARGASALEQRWSTMHSEGVAESDLAGLRHTLMTSQFEASWWAPVWWTDTGASFISTLGMRSDAVW